MKEVLMVECASCHYHNRNEAKFCSQCGKQLGSVAPPKVYSEVSVDRGVYRITFAPVEAEFAHDDAAADAARHSAWGEDREFGERTVEKVRSTIPISEFPFVCVCGDTVSDSDEKWCGYCDERNWIRRE